ncbi:hypothetical protein [Mycobacterium sp. 141]|uniref:hypothetical protein n=1 Tax=Mycobacterium sp. 141 TaxID=1120797 RepID=UPI00036F3D8F|nr:hypothetical protein [Mycobacterium sp. 141]
MHRLGYAVAGLAAAAALVSCSTESGPQPAPTSTPPEHGSFAHCLTDHGVPPAPGPVAGPPAGVDAGTWQKAMTACSDLAPGPS